MNDAKHKLFGRNDMSLSQVVAASVTHGFPIASLVKETIGTTKLEEMDMIEELELSGQKVAAGDMSYIEKALVRQFTALDALFGELGTRAMRCKELSSKEIHMKLALRAQSQARAAAETLGALKCPSVVFARQANVATGPQQINNAVTVRRARKKVKRIELLPEASYDDKMDTRAKGQTSSSNSEMEALVIEHRSKNSGGKSSLKAK